MAIIHRLHRLMGPNDIGPAFRTRCKSNTGTRRLLYLLRRTNRIRNWNGWVDTCMVPTWILCGWVSSGTEACMRCIALARGYTGKINSSNSKFGYHGHADAFLVKAVEWFGNSNINSARQSRRVSNDTWPALQWSCCVEKLVAENKNEIAHHHRNLLQETWAVFYTARFIGRAPQNLWWRKYCFHFWWSNDSHTHRPEHILRDQLICYI